MEKKTLIVGHNSFIAKHIGNIFDYDKISYSDLSNYDLKQYGVVINCALNPLFKTQKYEDKIDVDFQVGVKACEAGCHYVTFSTSKVYPKTSTISVYDEYTMVEPFDYYGENKLKTEGKLISNYGDKTTILRGSNIFGFEYGRNSFLGYCMSQLVNEGKITLTLADTVTRDFLPVESLSYIIDRVIQVRPLGIYNLSANYGLSVRTIVTNLIKGYDYGGVITKKSYEIDRQFIMNNSKLKNTLGIEIGPFDYYEIFNNLGKRLCKI